MIIRDIFEGDLTKPKKFVHRQRPVTKTDKFRQWFRGSEVVDSNHNPLPVFHGTGEDFSIFKRESEKRRAYGLNRLGYWFDVHPDTANYFADLGSKYDGGNVIMVYLSIKKPLIFDSEPIFKDDAKILSKHIKNNDWGSFNTFANNSSNIAKRRSGEVMDRIDSFDHLMKVIAPETVKRTSSEYERYVEKYRNDAIAEGYDGILLKNTLADAPTRKGRLTDWWIAFHSNQIKSVTGNSGNFDPNDEDINA